MQHLVLLGDSIFDNGIYAQGGPAVIRQVQDLLPPGDRATLLAVDGHRTLDVPEQLKRLPSDATGLVVSVGGNDALDQAMILGELANSFAQVLDRMATISEKFGHAYEQMLAALLAQDLPTVVCTIYYPRFPDPTEQRLASTALTFFNDVILRRAFAAGVPVLDLRLICDGETDYANPIEPSSSGGAKIAAAIIQAFALHDFGTPRSTVFVSGRHS